MGLRVRTPVRTTFWAWEGERNSKRGSMSGKVTRSPVRDTSRVSVSPMTAFPSTAWKPRVEKGIRTSANQPWSETVVFASQ